MIQAPLRVVTPRIDKTLKPLLSFCYQSLTNDNKEQKISNALLWKYNNTDFSLKNGELCEEWKM